MIENIKKGIGITFGVAIGLCVLSALKIVSVDFQASKKKDDTAKKED